MRDESIINPMVVPKGGRLLMSSPFARSQLCASKMNKEDKIDCFDSTNHEKVFVLDGYNLHLDKPNKYIHF